MTQWTVYISGPVGEFYWWPPAQKAKATEFCTVAPEVGSSTVWHLLLRVTLLDSKFFGLLPDFWKMYAPLLLAVKLLTPNPVWSFCIRARRERVQGLGANCKGSVSTCYEVWLCFVKWANDVGWEHHFVTIMCCYFYCPANTAMWISYSWSLYDTTTCFGCLYRPSSGRALVHRKVKRGEASP